MMSLSGIMTYLEPIWAELFLAIAAMALLVYGVLQRRNATSVLSLYSIVACIGAFILLLQSAPSGDLILKGMFIHDSFSLFSKILILAGGIAVLALSIKPLYQDNMARFEYPVLVLLSIIGMMIMVSAHDMLSLYMGLELQSLCFYVLAAMRRDHLRSAESGMKYFILGAISSGLLLFGISLLYGYTGSTNFAQIAMVLETNLSIGHVIGIVFIICALAFKISAVPFHMWTPDVYQGAPIAVTALFAIVPKVAAIALLTRLVILPFGAMDEQLMQILWVLSAASMIVGAFAGLKQQSIKRLLAYSSIGNVGYMLMGLVAGTQTSIAAMMLYMAIYMSILCGIFALIHYMRRNHVACEDLNDLSGLSRTYPWAAYGFLILLFSLAGIPPLAGFIGKLAIFNAAVEAQLYGLAILGVVTSVVAAYYYLRIIKVMFFDEAAEPFDKDIATSVRIVAGLSVLISVGFILYPSFLFEITQFATMSLF